MHLDINPKFESALNLLENSSHHLFITGKAGTGKSTLLKHFRSHTKKKHAVLAPTGVAAINVEGETVHSFFLFKPGASIEEIRIEARKRKDVNVYTNLDLIIIDEISMMRADLLDCIDKFLRIVRKTESPFGGIQMAFFGDLYQLPPVLTREEKNDFLMLYDSPYFFDSKVMQNLKYDLYTEFKTIELIDIYRQNDENFIKILNNIRENKISVENLNNLNKNLNKKPNESKSIHLVATNAQADKINKEHLDKIHEEEFEFVAEVSGDFEEKSYPTDYLLYLKKGARVMFIKNDPFGKFVNGSLGTITSITDDDIDEVRIKVKLDNGKSLEVSQMKWDKYRTIFNQNKKSIDKENIGSFTQIPLKLAWAVTIHKSQGKTFDNVIIDLGFGAFAHGQTYVALSRCRTLEGIELKKPIKYSDIIMDVNVREFMEKIC